VTRFAHQQHSGRRKKAKAKRQRKGLEIQTLAALRAHRELAYLRNPNQERARKLAEAKVDCPRPDAAAEIVADEEPPK
jgi:hypothetical protein